MKGRLYCLDNDILQKLATFELFDETLRNFEAEPTEVSILATAKYKFQGNFSKLERGRLRHPQAKLVNYTRTIELANVLPQIAESAVDADLFSQLSTFDDIDPGEAILTAYVVSILQKEDTREAFILTGDKRYLRALVRVDSPDIQKLLSHRFWCLEQLVLRNIEAYGFETVRQKIAPVRDCDTACKVVFGSGILSTEDNAVAAINQYITTLREETGGLLHIYPG